MPAVASRLMSLANTWLAGTSENVTPLVAVRPRPRTRNAAIWPRVTGSDGQKRSLAGALQPLVMPAVASLSMSTANVPAVSTKSEPPVAVRSRARTRKAAIWPRLTSSRGQNRTFVGGSQPRVMPAAATASMAAS